MISKEDKIFFVTSVTISAIMNYIMCKNMPSLGDRNFKLHMIIWASMILIGLILQFYIGFKIGIREFKKK